MQMVEIRLTAHSSESADKMKSFGPFCSERDRYLIGVGASHTNRVEQVLQAVRYRPQIQCHLA